ncbi:methyltransferase domain-containing protein [Halomicroarcula sp. S1AR25-4]|uniref:class I SAM-dependent methyltransferase n=1 Tax=Haloarcula sp. S1AR25-4 TaxID=2950538 RepID=UPI0028767353|nr:methyltransferase domain-containing protein [Halomicroarcula sp. S1AR25-4]MDS0279780.1 methyltransferase domain-containing protein [Halomicroarcula sp. S1AR25-4]
MRRRSKLLVTGVALAIGSAVAFVLKKRNDPAPLPYEQRHVLDLPRLLKRSQLQEVLAPESSEHILEVGPGTGRYSLPVARELDQDGSLHVLDVQEPMLDHTVERAREQGVDGITVTHADAQEPPYPDENFDAAYMVSTIGEIPDQEQALEELYRVLRPGGRLVVGESIADPDMVRFGTLRDRCESVGFRFERRVGRRISYFARFRKPAP